MGAGIIVSRDEVVDGCIDDPELFLKFHILFHRVILFLIFIHLLLYSV